MSISLNSVVAAAIGSRDSAGFPGSPAERAEAELAVGQQKAWFGRLMSSM